MLEIRSEHGYFGEVNRQRHSLWAAVLAGLSAAIVATVLLCRTPQSPISQLALVLLAAGYLALAAFSGATGSYVYWIRSRVRSTPGLTDLLQSTVTAWVWIPAIVLLSRQDSIWAPAVAAAGAAVLAISLRRTGPTALDQDSAAPIFQPQQELFAQSLQRTPAEWYGPIVAVSIYAEVLVLERRWLFPGCVFLALAAFAFAWACTPASHPDRQGVTRITAATLRQAKSAIPALIITMLAMIIGMRHDIEVWSAGYDFSHQHSAGTPQITEKSQANQPKGIFGGHFSIILLTTPQRQQIIAPRRQVPLFLGTHLIKPLTIQFDGEYWYFQFPDSRPGTGAYITHGSPLATNIHSATSIPLFMQAHQRLSTPLSLQCCSEVAVEIENRDNHPGTLSLEMILTDSTSPGKPSLSLGQRPIPSSQTNHLTSESASAHEKLRFAIPSQSGAIRKQLRQFDQIDFVVLPDPSRMQSGAKVAIRTVEFIP